MKLKNLLWDEHQNDPDNWLTIPEFYVLPKDVEFVGFSFPIFGPMANDFYWKVPIFEAVHSVRKEARRRFENLSDLTGHYVSAIMSDEVTFDPAGDTPINWDNQQVFAWRYFGFMDSLRLGLASFRSDKSKTIANVGHAMCYALDMYSDKPLDAIARKAARSEMARAGAAGRIARDPKQSDKASVRECWELWQHEPNRYKGPSAFARDMRSKFENLESDEVIRRWCREWKIATEQAQ